MSDNRSGRKIHLDLLRIIGAYMVMFNHTNEAGYMLFTVARDSSLY